MAFHMVHKPYSGDGTTKQTLKFNFVVGDPRATLIPKAVFVVRFADGAGTPTLACQSGDMPPDSSQRSSGNSVITNGAAIRDRNPGGFSVGKITGSSFANHVGEQYIATGMWDDNDITGNGKEFEAGQYTGDGTGTRSIEVGFQPDMISVWREGTRLNMFWFRSKGGDNATPGWGTQSGSFLTGNVEGVASTGFTVGTALNANNQVYNWLAWRVACPRISEGTYTGTGAALNIPVACVGLYLGATGFVPYRYLGIKREKSTGALYGYSIDRQNAGDTFGLTYFDSNSDQADAITSVVDDSGFTLGLDLLPVAGGVNLDGDTYHYFFLQGDPGFIPARLPPPAPTLYSGTDFTGSPYHVYKQNKFLSEEFQRFKLGPG